MRTLSNDAGMSGRAIAKKLDIPRTTIQDMLNSNSSRRPPTTRQRPPILSDEKIDNMIEIVTTNYHTRTLPWCALAKAVDRDDCSDDTIRRAMHKRGYFKCKACKHPYISPVAATKRLFWTNTDHRFEQDLEYWLP